jgi:hypothetical protein
MSAQDSHGRSELNKPPPLPHFAVEAGQAKAAQGSHRPGWVGTTRIRSKRSERRSDAVHQMRYAFKKNPVHQDLNYPEHRFAAG